MEGFIARPPISLQQLDKTGDQEKFLVRVQSVSGGTGLPYDEFVLSISDTCLGIWQHASGVSAKQVAEQLATMIVELHGTTSAFSDDYFFSSINTSSAASLADVVGSMQSERTLDAFVDHR